MSVSYIPEPLKVRLWGQAGGRCEYEGCNRPLYRDDLTQAEFNTAYIAHIVADQPNGPRGDEALSKKLASDIRNLMILCDVHHRLIDKAEVERHTVELLTDMKRRHEQRIELLTSIDADKQSHVLLYGSKIGKHNAPVHFELAAEAMVPDRYPAEPRAISIGMKSAFDDGEEVFWDVELVNLNREFANQVKQRLGSETKHLSVFAFAPMPLLIELGRLIGDIQPADVYDRHREPPPSHWKWSDPPKDFEFQLVPPDDAHKGRKTAALVLSLSGEVSDDRIHRAIGTDVAIWGIKHPTPKPGFLKSRDQLMKFREIMRVAFDRVKAVHGYDVELHLFPAAPLSACVEVGRVWMPKADPPFRVYDQNRERNGFVHVHTISP